jgi:hypothetical protein
MARHLGFGVMLVTTMLAWSSPASGADYCISFGPSSTEQFVGKKFKVPKPGQCKPWNGFLVTSFSNVSISTGTGCTSSDGTTFRLNLATTRENFAFQDYVVLPLPAATGGTLSEFLTGQTGTDPHFTFDDMRGAPCDLKTFPVP